MRIFLISLMAVVLVAGCEKRSDRIAFDGVFYNAKAKKTGDDLSVFQVSVTPAAASLTGAREAGRFEATRYCIENFGSSDVKWSAGPDAEDAALIIDGNTLYLRGKCMG